MLEDGLLYDQCNHSCKGYIVKKPTLSDISTLSGVSKSTVSRVLNHNMNVQQDIREKVEAAMEKCGYERKKTNVKLALPFTSVTLISTDSFDSPDLFYAEMLQEVRLHCEKIGLKAHLVLLNENHTQQQIEEKLASVEAAMLLGSEDRNLMHILEARGIPKILVNGVDDEMRVSSISPDYDLGGRLAANYLIEQGHVNMKILTAQTRHSLRQRTESFLFEARLKGISSCDKIDILDYCELHNMQELKDKITQGKAGSDFGAQHVLPKMLDEGIFDGVTAIFCVCDKTAISLIDALECRGYKVPDDISVLGCDNLSISSMLPVALSSIGCDFSVLASSAIHLLMEDINESHTTARRINVGVELFKRASVLSV